MINRNYSIDLLRGIAILGMVFAAVIPYDPTFPGWMYHAQVGPPTFSFNPEIPGITWVDLVFPFFLFSMGAAFPLAMQKKVEQKAYGLLSLGLFRRAFLLVFFAITLAYLSPSNLTASAPVNQLTALLTFGAYFLVFMRFEGSKTKQFMLQASGFLTIAALIYYHSEFVGNSFSKAENNIILLILANMAFFGGISWLLTYRNYYARLLIIAAYMGLWLTKDIPGAWSAKLFEFHSAGHWFYNFAFLKYLCIVLPGSILGDLLIKNKEIANSTYTVAEKPKAMILAFMAFFFVVFQVITLYLRELPLNLLGHAIFGLCFLLFFHYNQQGKFVLYRQLVGWGFALASIALCFEPLDGGIKKDPSSFSYWFLTSGMAFIMYCFCDYMTKGFKFQFLISPIVKCGQNPMIAYTVTACFTTPILGLLSISPLLDTIAQASAYGAWGRTLLYMTLLIAVSSYATSKRWFWRS